MTRFVVVTVLLFLLVVPVVDAIPSRGSSTGERALFGYSYSEDCLFGTTSHLYGSPTQAGVAASSTSSSLDSMTVPAIHNSSNNSNNNNKSKDDPRFPQDTLTNTKELPRTVAFVRDLPKTPYLAFVA